MFDKPVTIEIFFHEGEPLFRISPMAPEDEGVAVHESEIHLAPKREGMFWLRLVLPQDCQFQRPGLLCLWRCERPGHPGSPAVPLGIMPRSEDQDRTLDFVVGSNKTPAVEFYGFNLRYRCGDEVISQDPTIVNNPIRTS